MNDFEQQHLPEEYKPLSPWKYFGLEILYSIPLVGLIFAICHALSSKNVNKKNFARALFCALLVAVILLSIMYAVVAKTGILQSVQEQFALMNA